VDFSLLLNTEVSFTSSSCFLVQWIFSAEASHAPLSILDVKICGALPPLPHSFRAYTGTALYFKSRFLVVTFICAVK